MNAERGAVLGQVLVSFIGHDHRSGTLEGCPLLLDNQGMSTVSDRLFRGPAARVSFCRLASADDAHVIQVSSDIHATTNELWIHRVVIAYHAHVMVPTQPDPLTHAELRWNGRRDVIDARSASITSTGLASIRRTCRVFAMVSQSVSWALKVAG